jgi:transcriptional regulator with XRE-family HTH domain
MAKTYILTPEQCRGARAMLDWTRDELAEHAGVGVATLAEFEAGRRTPYDRTLRDIRSALETAGIEILPENGGGPGLRFRKPDDVPNGKGTTKATVTRPAVKKPRGEEGIAAAAC